MKPRLVSLMAAAAMLAACASAPAPAVSQAGPMPELAGKDVKHWDRAARDIRKGEKLVAEANGDLEKQETKARKARQALRKAEDKIADAKADARKGERLIEEGKATQDALSAKAAVTPDISEPGA